MTDRPRDNDNDLIDEMTDVPTPSQGSASGGDLAREVGQRDELQSADGDDASVTRVQKKRQSASGRRAEPAQPQRN